MEWMALVEPLLFCYQANPLIDPLYLRSQAVGQAQCFLQPILGWHRALEVGREKDLEDVSPILGRHQVLEVGMQKKSEQEHQILASNLLPEVRMEKNPAQQPILH